MTGIDDFPLLPADDDPGVSPEDDLDAAAASLEDAATAVEEETETPEPFGRTPLFDFQRGRFIMAGTSPVYVTGLRALEQWCLMAIYTARYAHAVFSDDFGLEDPDSVLGEAANAVEAASDWGERLRDALLVHDRVTAVEDFSARYLEDEGVMLIDRFAVITDEEDRLEFGGLDVPVGVENA